eukprot:274199-Pleurochrysis_carterae.AAC.2
MRSHPRCVEFPIRKSLGGSERHATWRQQMCPSVHLHPHPQRSRRRPNGRHDIESNYSRQKAAVSVAALRPRAGRACAPLSAARSSTPCSPLLLCTFYLLPARHRVCFPISFNVVIT